MLLGLLGERCECYLCGMEPLSEPGIYLYRIIRSLFSVQAADGRFDDTGVFLDLEDGSSGVLVDHVLLDGVLQLGVGAFFQVVVVDGRHRHHHHAGSAVLSHVAIVHTLKVQDNVSDYLTVSY